MNKFNVLVADCPWYYNNKRTGGSLSSGSEQHYQTMTLDDLHSLNSYLDNVMDDNSVLFLWITNPMLPDGLQIMKSWGFTYKGCITWVKKSYGLGYWFRGKTEHMLLGVRGKVKPFRTNLPNVIISDTVYRHSEKPYESYKLITEATQHMKPKPNVLELFARRPFRNWTCIGSELTGNDIRKDLQNLINSNR